MQRTRSILALALALAGAAGDQALAQTADVASPPPVSGRSHSAPETFDAGDVMARLKFVHDNLEKIRVYMGRPPAPLPLFQATNANADEAYFTALNLFRRGMRLAFEQLRIEQKWRFNIPDKPTTYDIYKVVDSLAVTALQLNGALKVGPPVAEARAAVGHHDDRAVQPDARDRSAAQRAARSPGPAPRTSTRS